VTLSILSDSILIVTDSNDSNTTESAALFLENSDYDRLKVDLLTAYFF
jgi:hypothetical protein